MAESTAILTAQVALRDQRDLLLLASLGLMLMLHVEAIYPFQVPILTRRAGRLALRR